MFASLLLNISVFQGVLIAVLALGGLYLLYKLLPAAISFLSGKINPPKK